MEGIQLSVEKTGVQDSISIIKIGGYIDTTTSSELEHALNSLLKSGSFNIIIDLGNVDYVSSAGWGIFISEIKGIREKGGDLKLVRMIPEVYEVFELLEFHYILKAFENIDEAINDFEKTGIVKESAKIIEISDKDKGTQQQGQYLRRSDSKTIHMDVSVEAKIKRIVASNPEAKTTQIARTLNTPLYGNTKIGWFALRRLL
ncbi:STAS domain-containing protein, partial [bacterium]|nr:STAS domain-containing protein [candidate division CSSED10-310 bacterium]